jgi:hypothetical protein
MQPVRQRHYLLQSYFHAQEKPLVTCDVDIVRPHIQGYQLESNPSKTLHERLSFVFSYGSIQANDYMRNSEDRFCEFDESHKSIEVRYV